MPAEQYRYNIYRRIGDPLSSDTPPASTGYLAVNDTGTEVFLARNDTGTEDLLQVTD